MVRITTWNVNGIRNPFGYKPWSTNRSFNAMFDILEADIVIMQELKIQRKDLTDDMVLVPGWDCYFSLPKHKKGIYTDRIAQRHVLMMARILRCWHLHPPVRLCPDPCRRGRTRCSLPPQLIDTIPRASRFLGHWWVRIAFASCRSGRCGSPRS